MVFQLMTDGVLSSVIIFDFGHFLHNTPWDDVLTESYPEFFVGHFSQPLILTKLGPIVVKCHLRVFNILSEVITYMYIDR